MKHLIMPAALLAAVLAAPLAAADVPPRFAEELYVFKVEDESVPPPQCATLFVGSSSIRFWFNLKQDFAFPLVRRGFGGSTIADVNANFDRLVSQYHPARIVFYAGENDLAGGSSTDETLARFAEFMAKKDAALGATPVEMVLVGLAGCLSAGIAAVAQNRRIALHAVKATLEADMDLRGILGVDAAGVRNGFEGIRVHYEIDADATQAQIEALVAQSQKRSAVFDILTNPTDVSVSTKKA